MTTQGSHSPAPFAAITGHIETATNNRNGNGFTFGQQINKTRSNANQTENSVGSAQEVITAHRSNGSKVGLPRQRSTPSANPLVIQTKSGLGTPVVYQSIEADRMQGSPLKGPDSNKPASLHNNDKTAAFTKVVYETTASKGNKEEHGMTFHNFGGL